MKSVAQWRRSPTTTRDFFFQDSLTSEQEKLSTAVVWISLIGNKIVLCKNHRGREFPGGHIEDWETLMEALGREIHEEAWITDYKVMRLHGVTHVINHEEKINKATWAPYPAIAYIPHFVIHTKNWERYPVWEEIIEANIFEPKSSPIREWYHLNVLESFLTN